MKSNTVLKEVADKTLEILEQGEFTNRRGERVDFLEHQQAAVANTVLYTPEDADSLLAPSGPQSNSSRFALEVTGETTQQAAHRLIREEGCNDLVLLNFASARSPGGGFLNGAKAQEEDLCRCSGLYPCLAPQTEYYTVNRSQNSKFYTDHLIYSPQVPWFRTRSSDILDDYFLASVITAPAPNAGQILEHKQGGWADIEICLRHRASLILAIARRHGHRNLVLGAWGCGVFRNQPEMVAGIFRDLLSDGEFEGCFERVTFAVYDPTPEQATLKAFQNQLLGS